MSRKQAWNINLFFVLLLFGFAAASFLVPKRTFSEAENRTLAQMPEVNADAVFSGSFESAYEDYLTDQFVARDAWISLRTLAEQAMLHREVHDVYLAKNRYLIEKHTGTFTSEQAEMNRNFLAAFAKTASAKYGSGHFSVLLVPNAVSILKNRLPIFASPFDEAAWLNNVRALLPEGVWFDAGEVLAAHADEEIFYRTDHHWKTLGAYYVFRAWAASVGLPVTNTDTTAIATTGVITDAATGKGIGRVDGYTIRSLTDTFVGTVASRIGKTNIHDSIEVMEPDLEVPYVLTYNRSDDVRSTYIQPLKLEGKDKYTVFFGGNFPLIQAETQAGSGRSILVIKDSYANCFIPFLFSYFDRVDIVDLRYYYDSLRDLMNTGNYTDVLFLENAAGFAEDTSLSRLNT